jgi:DNA-binding MarR family transcriptional regulator
MKFDRIAPGAVSSLEKILHANVHGAERALDTLNALASERKGVPPTAAVVKVAIKARRDRDAFLPAHLFADPAWDMLLELYACELDQTRMSISNLCDASAVPATTALRWIGTLESEGLIQRQSDPLDARRFFVRLTSKAVSSMEAYFQR